MDTHQLQAFISVAESGSFSIAAEKLHLTQPAISKRIAALERSLDARLFDRIGKRVILTEAGTILMQRARSIMLEINATRTRITNLSGSVTGRLKLASSHHIGLHRLPPILKSYATQYPQVSIDISFLDSEEAYEQVSHGELELAVVTLAPEAQARMVSRPIWDDPLCIMVANDHSLVKHHQADLGSLLDHPVILPAENTFTRQVVENLFRSRNLSLEIEMSTNYLETIRMMVSIGMAWSVLPRTMLDDTLRILNFPEINLSRKLGYIYHQHHTLSNAARAFIDLLENHVDNTTGHMEAIPDSG